MFRMGNMFVSSFLWFHGTKEKRAVKKGGALGEVKVPHAPRQVHRTDLASAKEESRHLEMGRREITAPRGC